MISVPEEYAITHFAGGAMPNDFRSIFSSSCSVPIWIFILGTKQQQKQNNQSISNNLSQTNIHLSKINFHGEFALDIAYINYGPLCPHSPPFFQTHNQASQSRTFQLLDERQNEKRCSDGGAQRCVASGCVDCYCRMTSQMDTLVHAGRLHLSSSRRYCTSTRSRSSRGR